MFGFKIVKTDLRSKLKEERAQLRAERDFIIYHGTIEESKTELKEALVKIKFITDILKD